MNLRLTFLVVTGISGVVFACSGSGGGGGGGSDSSSFIAELCGLYAPCCGKLGKPTDGASCRAVYGGLVGSQQYDPGKGSACLSELRALSSTPTFCDNPSAPSCKGAFKEAGSGNKQPGEECSKDGDCAPSGEGNVNCASNYSGSSETRACQIELEGKAGDTPCISTRDGNVTSTSFSSSSGGDAGPQAPPARGFICDVAKGVYCDGKSKACEAIHNVGESCESFDSYACVKTAFCDSLTRKCLGRRAVGEDCSTNSQSCTEKTNCDQVTKKCVAGLPDGTACKTSSQCASDHCVNSKCDPDSGDLASQLLCGGN
jgi:hypothetical protein